MQRIPKGDTYYPKKDCGRRSYGELSMTQCIKAKSEHSLWPRTMQLNGLRVAPKTVLMSVISLTITPLILPNTILNLNTLEKLTTLPTKPSILNTDKNTSIVKLNMDKVYD